MMTQRLIKEDKEGCFQNSLKELEQETLPLRLIFLNFISKTQKKTLSLN
jgi:hypothetical protein